jgi:Beta/Gamma crystallin
MLFKLFIVCGLIAIGALSVQAADMEVKMVDKNCWIEVFDDTKYDADDPHVKVDGPKEFASLKNLNGRDWNNDIQSIIVGSGAMVLAYQDKDFKGTEIAFASGQRIPDLSKLDMSNDIESMKITCAN